MHLTLAYLGRSGLAPLPRLFAGQGGGAAGGQMLNLVPNLSRPPVSFDAPLLQPLRFREAMSALHDVVVSDLRYRPRDKTAYAAWKKSEQERLRNVRQETYAQAKADILEQRKEPVPTGLEQSYRQCLRHYWAARQKYAGYLLAHDRTLWRLLMPCDPVVTVASDVVLFECFSADESSYGCLGVAREGGFGPSDAVQMGTTNVDYSWELYQHFQSLRSYKETRLRVDPAGFEVATGGQAGYREEKIELPAGWLRGFLQIQAAAGLPMRKVSLPREAVYSVLAWLGRHKAHKSPRALRFELEPGRAPELVMEPWEKRVVAHGAPYLGPPGAPIRIWGQRRLLALARVLPLCESFECYLLGTGLPSFWVARMGEMRLTLGLSGWTANDWTRGSALDLLAPPQEPAPELVGRVARDLHARGAATLTELAEGSFADRGRAAAALDLLAHRGQVVFDLGAGLYRWRSVMPVPVAEEQLGPENAELRASREIVAYGSIRIDSRQAAPEGGTLYAGTVGLGPVELLLDADGRIRRGRCNCTHHFKAGLRKGPCRHLLALRSRVSPARTPQAGDDGQNWYERLLRWAWN